ncbi:YgiW/YdeI family stress tolerance OB fold protein [Vibrio sp. LaRot3]|uniref:YgiW/YdeI family stress tolerance OB fold protein n=1 Tax=Vibrio sp. LaRot3 TaxID=2998829 RepID=UPI0022CE343F|nr:NirD/YgiW/YdeI family stress tolerance protein [Vibrio sp. LaRot3]MDA0148364.1 NirD/YgiW/YdeI family stress tolerance protein [Vibrio sp. LaRot3]
MKKLMLATALTLAPTIAMANGHSNQQQSIQYQGPVDITSVATLLQDTGMFTKKDVVVEGFLVKQINQEAYVFSDGNAEIRVELDDDIRLNQAINATTRLRLYGEYEGGSTPEIDVDNLQVL